MIYNSSIFIFIFLPITCVLQAIIPIKLKKYIVILLSFIFYSWANLGNFFILICFILLNYGLALIIQKTKINKFCFITTIILNTSFLFLYKYLMFFASAVNYPLEISIIAPLGISFFVFSCISFHYDIYIGKVKLCTFLEFVSYISIFTKLISGPILLYRDFVGQINDKLNKQDDLVYGLERFIIGLSKKVLIADILGVMVDEIFISVNFGIDTPTAWLGALAYTLQIYYDFSGYSDMAIGLSAIFGIKLFENFNFPYISKSISEFWRRWHISLGNWFKNYIYIPLGGNRKGIVSLNLFLVFLLTGIWHGANYTFILWGIGYGIIRIIENKIFKNEYYKKIPDFIKWASTFIIIMLFWVLFRSSDLNEAILYLSRMFGLNGTETIDFTFKYYLTLKNGTLILFAFLGALVFSKKNIQECYNKLMKYNLFYFLKLMILIYIFIICIVAIVNTGYSPNIYFQF